MQGEQSKQSSFFDMIYEELIPADPETVVRGPGRSPYLDGVLVDNFLVGLGVALLVDNIPAQRLKERSNKFNASLRFIVRGAGVMVSVAPVVFNQRGNSSAGLMRRVDVVWVVSFTEASRGTKTRISYTSMLGSRYYVCPSKLIHCGWHSPKTRKESS